MANDEKNKKETTTTTTILIMLLIAINHIALIINKKEMILFFFFFFASSYVSLMIYVKVITFHHFRSLFFFIVLKSQQNFNICLFSTSLSRFLLVVSLSSISSYASLIVNGAWEKCEFMLEVTKKLFKHKSNIRYTQRENSGKPYPK